MLGLGHGAQTDTVGLAEIFSNNYSLDFDGANDYIDLDSKADMIDPAKGTFSAWVMVDTTSTTGQIVSCRRDANNLIQLFYHAGTNELRGTHKGDGTTQYANVDAGETIENSGNFHHVAMTWDTGDGDVKVYQDGVLKETTAGILNFGGDGPNKLDIGKSSGGDSGHFDGHIDEVSIFTEVVDIATLYNGGSPQDVQFSALAGLVGYYRFTEGSGSDATDESGNNNHGTLIHSPSWSTDTP
tara:strand:+ start:398 stop:1120 length:723 start_codon:yes stop_codon:yes gene_type:complete